MSLNVNGVNDPTTNKFVLDTSDVLGYNYQAYISSVRALALSEPKKYFEMRAQVMTKVRGDAIGKLYQSLFNVLTAGRDIDNHPIGSYLGTKGYVPCYPSDRTNNFVVECAREMAEWIEKAIDIILPDNFETLASSKMSLKGKGEIVGN